MIFAPDELGILVEQRSHFCGIVSIITPEFTQLVYKTKEAANLLLVCRGLHVCKLFYSARVRANLWRIGTRQVKDNFMS